jgi:hypothetical protein
MNRTFRAVTVGSVGLACLLLAPPAQPAEATKDGLVPQVIVPARSDISPALRDIPVAPIPYGKEWIVPIGRIPRPAAVTKGPDAVAHTPTAESVITALKLNFDGQSANGVAPPDTNGAVGLTQYVQWVNLQYTVYDKNTGAVVGGPFPGTHFWAGFGGPCQSFNSGDPIIQYDKAAGRWVGMQFAFQNFSAASICVAVSTTPDALGTYARYEYKFGNQFPDYPKLGVWPDGYYFTVNTFPNGGSFTGAKACALDRTKMLAGLAAPNAICFQLAPSEASLLPSDLDGPTPPPAGSPNYNIELGNSTTLRLWKFHSDFLVPANSTFTGPTLITVAGYSDANLVPQPAPGELLDSLGDRMMYRLPYRNFGTHEVILANHSVNNAGKAAVRWYEIRNLSGAPSIFQQGTIAAGNVHLWMGSLAMDKMGNIAVGFSASNNLAVKPSVGVTGRLPGDAPGTMRTPHGLVVGTGVQTGTFNRWGDYSAMAIDPIDDCTLWYTQEYIKTTGSFNWSTRISSFTFPNCQ